MKGVAAFVEEDFDIELEASGVHEYEGLFGCFERRLESTGAFAMTGVEVEVAVVLEGLELGSVVGGDAVEGLACFFDEGVDVLFIEGAEGRSGVDVNSGVPGFECVEVESLAALFIEIVEEGHDEGFDGVGEVVAVLGGVVEAFFL